MGFVCSIIVSFSATRGRRRTVRIVSVISVVVKGTAGGGGGGGSSTGSGGGGAGWWWWCSWTITRDGCGGRTRVWINGRCCTSIAGGWIGCWL